MSIVKIPFARSYFTEAMIKNVTEEIGDAYRRGEMSNGESVRKLEERVAHISGADYGVACGCCSIGLQIAIGASGVQGTGITQSFTWDSTVIAINAVETGVHYLDIDYDRWTIKSFPAMPKAAYALAVDTFGMEFQPESRIPVFFDRAHSLGVKFRKLGMASVLSFSPSKICPGGEGGMILTNKERYAEAYVNARNIISRMSTANALTALEQLKVLPDLLDWKRETYAYYKQRLPEFKFQQGEGNHQVIGCLADTNALRDRIMERTADHMELKAYYKPLHLRTNGTWNLLVTEDVAARIICLPSWYGVDRDRVVELIREAME